MSGAHAIKMLIGEGFKLTAAIEQAHMCGDFTARKLLIKQRNKLFHGLDKDIARTIKAQLTDLVRHFIQSRDGEATKAKLNAIAGRWIARTEGIRLA